MKEANKNGKLYCLLSAVIIIGCYAAQRTLALTADATRTLVIVEAMVFSLAVAVVYFLVTRSNEAFYGILISLLGFKMMPPDIGGLRTLCPGAYIVYYIVCKAAVVIFALAIIKLFRMQKGREKIGVLPVLFLIAAVPFSNEISATIASFVNGYANGNRLYEYFILFAFYSATMLLTLFLASKCSYISAKLMCEYSIVALCVNLARRVCVAVIYTAKDYHVSKSYFCWMAIYVFFIIAFSLLEKKKLQQHKK